METIIFNFAPLQGVREFVILPYPEFRLEVQLSFLAFITIVEPYLNRHPYSYQTMADGNIACVLQGEDVLVVWRACQRTGKVDPLDSRVPITLVHVER